MIKYIEFTGIVSRSDLLIYRIFHGCISLLQNRECYFIHQCPLDSWLIDIHCRTFIIPTCIVNKKLLIGKCLFIEHFVEFFYESPDRSGCLNIWYISYRIITQSVCPPARQSNRVNKIHKGSILGSDIITGKLCIDILQKIFREALICKIFCIRNREAILIEAPRIKCTTLIESIIIEYSWRECRRNKFPFFCIEIMRLIEKYSYLVDIIPSLPNTPDTRIDHTMPDLDIRRLTSTIRILISTSEITVDESLIIEVHIGVETRKTLPFSVYDRERNIPDQYRPDETRDSPLTIPIIVEFFILGCESNGRSICIDDKQRDSSIPEIGLDILTIPLNLARLFRVRFPIDHDGYEVTIVIDGGLDRVKKRNLNRL